MHRIPRQSLLELESAFRRCLGLSSDAAVTLSTNGYTLPEAAEALYVQLPYLKGVLRGTYHSPRLILKIATLPRKTA